MEGLIEKYIQYMKESEASAIYLRWAMHSAIGGAMGRRTHIPFGYTEMYPNQFIVLMGPPGARKNTSINPALKLLKKAGYRKFASNRLSKEMFLVEMQKLSLPLIEEAGSLDDIMNLTLEDETCEIFAVAPEFNDFVGTGNGEFLTMLGNLWDCGEEYTHPKLHGESVVVKKPVVNLLGGNTPANLVAAIPPEANGNGFMSRVLFIHSDGIKKKVSWPVPPDPKLGEEIVDGLRKIMDFQGPATFTQEAREFATEVYETTPPMPDSRFLHYDTRRHTHFLKLSFIRAASFLRMEVTMQDMLYANTALIAAERHMPKALGEFGKSRYSGISSAILTFLGNKTTPQSIQQIYEAIARDVNKMSEAVEIVKGLITTGKLMAVTGVKPGYVLVEAKMQKHSEHLCDFSLLTKEEVE